MTEMNVAVVQTQPVFGEVEQNLGRALARMNSVAADLYVLPELFSTGYCFEDRNELASLAEPMDGPTVQALADFSLERDCAIHAGLAEAADDKIFNSSVLLVGGRVKAVYRKLHLFDEEKKLFDVDHGRPRVVEIPDAKLGLMICFDWVFPEMARTLAMAGAQILCHPSNLVLPYCQQAMITRSLENRVFTLLANRVGEEQHGGKSLCFTGGSEIVDPRGKVLASASLDQEEVIRATIDPDQANDKMMTPGNHLFVDRRPELYNLGPWEDSGPG